MADDVQQSLGDQATFAGGSRRGPASETSLGDERTILDGTSGRDTVVDGIEIVDIDARYKVEGTLGQGGMGAVLLATDTRLGRKVAVKRILGEAAGNRMAVARFLTEAKAIAALNHPHVVQIYDYGRAKDGPFLIMEYVDGGSLLDRCKAGAIPFEEAIDLACQICDGLARAHDQGIIHRDIKPANVLLTADGIPKLTDFGLAKAQSGDHGQTMTGAVLGTPDFMPPEQRRDASEADARSDLWSLAATFYQMVTGRSPKVIRLNDVPAALQGVLAKALEEDQDARYQTVREFRDALKATLRATVPAEAAAPAEAGQCPSCGAANDASRRFCRGCGGSLEVACLSCATPMPMGEEICGSCGARQTPLVEQRQATLAAAQANAEGLLGDFEFAKAVEVASPLREESHPRLARYKDWAAGFLAQARTAQEEQVGRAKVALDEALHHEAASDYAAGIRTLEAVPQAVREQVAVGQGQSIEDVLTRLTARLAESKALDSEIRAAVKDRALAGLLPKVARLAELRPDRADVVKLCGQLEERLQRLVQQRDALLEQARQAFARQDYVAAVKALEQIDREVSSDESIDLGRRCEAAQARTLVLQDTIKAAVAEKRYDGLLEAIDEYCTLKPATPDLERIRAHLVQRTEAAAAERAAARRRFVRRMIGSACLILLLAGAAAAGGLLFRKHLEKEAALKAAIDGSRWDDALAIDAGNTAALVGRARARLAARQPDVAGAFADIAAAVKEGVAPDVIRELQGAALLARARTKLATAPPDVDGAFEDLASLESIAPVSAQAKEAKAAAFAARAAVYAAADRIADAEKALAEAQRLGASDSVTAAGQAAVVASHLARAERLVVVEASEDVDAIATACDAALNAGASRDRVTGLWLRFINDAVKKMNPRAVRQGIDRAVQAGLREKQAAEVWNRLAETALERLDADGLEAACAVQDAYGLAAAMQATLWQRFAEAALEKGDAAAVAAACTKAAEAGASPTDLAAVRTRGTLLEARTSLGRGETDAALKLVARALEEDESVAFESLRQSESRPLADAVLRDSRMRFDAAVAGDDLPEAARANARAARLDAGAASWFREVLTQQRMEQLSPDVISQLPAAAILALPPLENSVGMKFKLIPPGTFTMGDGDLAVGSPAHRVTISQAFYIGIHEVTRGQSKDAMPTRLDATWQGDPRPVSDVSWDEVVDFCRILSELPRERAAGREYRLPTEAEWEFACRAGTTTRFSFGDDQSQLPDHAWFTLNARGPNPVGQKKPNPWELYDMHGNVAEWCHDWYDSNPHLDATDPRGPPQGFARVFRGGGYSFDAYGCGSARRYDTNPPSRSVFLGFRLALSPAGSGRPGAGK